MVGVIIFYIIVGLVGAGGVVRGLLLGQPTTSGIFINFSDPLAACLFMLGLFLLVIILPTIFAYLTEKLAEDWPKWTYLGLWLFFMSGYIFLAYIIKSNVPHNRAIKLTYRVVFQYVGPAFYFIPGVLCLAYSNESRASFKIALIQTIAFIVFFFGFWIVSEIIIAMMSSVGGIMLGILILLILSAGVGGGSTYIVKKID